MTILNAVYDLWVSPPTYDFIGFLIEAEKARIQGKHEAIDVYFMPGPNNGFRDDNLPPDIPTRHGMLHRICVSACRLLPSVRNTAVFHERYCLEGDIFPKGWDPRNPVSHYGSAYFKGCARPLKATDSARRMMRYPPYVTITLRQSSYWPERNSDLEAWGVCARWLESKGHKPVFIPDTEGVTGLDHFEVSKAASVDIDVRLALYEGAVLNLGVSNGPMALLYGSECRYIVFKPVIESCVSTGREFLASHGMNEGDQWGTNGKLVWKPDTAETIIGELDQWAS